MKKWLAILAGVVAWGSAHASVVSYDFTAVVSDIREYETTGSPQVNVQSTLLTGTEIKIGQVLHGHFSYDTNAGLSSEYQPPVYAGGSNILYGGYGDQGAVVGADNVHALSLPFTPFHTNLGVANNEASLNGNDEFSLSINSWAINGAQLIDWVLFRDASGQAWNSSAIPASLDLNRFDSAIYSFSYFMPTGGSVHFGASITQLTATSAVPEPEGYAMLLAGLLVMAGARRARR